MLSLAVGVLGLSITEFENATLRQIDCIYKGYEQQERIEWNRVRWATQYTILPHLKQRDFQRVSRGMQFEWEKEKTEFKGDVDAILKKWDQIPVKK